MDSFRAHSLRLAPRVRARAKQAAGCRRRSPRTDPPLRARRPTEREADGSEVCLVPIGLLPQAVGLRDWLLAKRHAGRTSSAAGGLRRAAERARRAGRPAHDRDRRAAFRIFRHRPHLAQGRRLELPAVPARRRDRTRSTSARPSPRCTRPGEWLLLDLDETPDDAVRHRARAEAGGVPPIHRDPARLHQRHAERRSPSRR